MSCEMQVTAIVENLNEIKTFFGLSAIPGETKNYFLCFCFVILPNFGLSYLLRFILAEWSAP